MGEKKGWGFSTVCPFVGVVPRLRTKTGKAYLEGARLTVQERSCGRVVPE